jgi:hypothetical protein
MIRTEISTNKGGNSMKPKHIKKLQAQSKKLTATRISRNIFRVESASHPDEVQTVSLRVARAGRIVGECSCEWSQHQGVACSHVLAALEHLAERKGRTLSFWLNPEDAERQNRRTLFLAADRHSPEDGVWITSRTA